MLLVVLAILLPCAGLIAAPGLTSSKVNGAIAVALGVIVIVPLDELVQLAVIVLLNVGAVPADTVTALVACVPHASVKRTV